MSQPVDFLEELAEIMSAEAEHDEAESRRRGQPHAGVATPAVPSSAPETTRTAEETLSLAAAAGLPLPGRSDN